MMQPLPTRYLRFSVRWPLRGRHSRALGLWFGLGAQGIAATCAFQALAAEPEDVTANVEQLSLEELMAVRISPFDVSTTKDRGYQAFSSVTGSRLDTPIKDLPFPIQ